MKDSSYCMSVLSSLALFLVIGWTSIAEAQADNDSWSWHPFAAGNNSNRVDADHNADGHGLDVG
jgi:hypothetical protein